MRLSFILILCVSLFNNGCASIKYSSKTDVSIDYKLRIGDELRIVIREELNEKAIIRPDYKISLPLIGEIDCKNKTPEVLSKELSRKYRVKAVVIVTKYHSWKDDFKGVVQFIRDSAIVYFIGKRVTD